MLLHYSQLVLKCIDPALAVLAVLREVLLDLLEHPLRLSEFLLRQLFGLLAHPQLLLHLLQVKPRGSAAATVFTLYHGREDAFLEIYLWIEGLLGLLQDQSQLLSETLIDLFELSVTLLALKQLAS